MSNEAKAPPAVPSPAPAEAAPPAEPIDQKPVVAPAAPAGGAKFIDLDGLDIPAEAKDALKARFSHFTRQLKDKEAALAELRKHNEALDEKIGGVVNKLDAIDKSRAADAKTALKAQLKFARDSGDFDQEMELQEKIAELNSMARVPAKTEEKKEEKKEDVIGNWESNQELRNFATEMNDEGGLKRPWVLPHNPEHSRAAATVFQIAETWKADGRSFGLGDVLKELDTRMAAPVKKAPPAVLPTGTTAVKVPAKVSLTPDQERVAKKMGIAPEKYAAQLKAVRAA